MFSHDRADDGLESKTRMFHPVRQVAAAVGRQKKLVVWSSSPGGGTGDEVCPFRLHLAYYSAIFSRVIPGRARFPKREFLRQELKKVSLKPNACRSPTYSV